MVSLNHRLSEFLFGYRSTPHATIGLSPSELFLQSTGFDLLKPDTKAIVETRQAKQKETHDQHAKLRNLSVGSPVMVPQLQSLVLS